MCTALSLRTREHYFGRNLDLDRSYGEEVCIVPRRYPLRYRLTGEQNEHSAMIGTATVIDGIPLFYDATNEYGLSMAGLNFPGNAFYAPAEEGKDNVTPFEFIPWILGTCKNLAEASKLLANLNLVDIPFSEHVPLSPLHWMIADRDESLVVEAMKDGLHIHENPVGVLTNNPPFEYQRFNLNNYRHLRVDNGENHLSASIPLETYCQGLGAIGLPGDVSSMSRFVRIAFGRANSVCEGDESSSVNQFFHLLSSVEMPRGVCRTPEETWDITVYSSCVNTDRGLYYYTTYDNRQITCVDMHRADLDGNTVSRYPMMTESRFLYRN